MNPETDIAFFRRTRGICSYEEVKALATKSYPDVDPDVAAEMLFRWLAHEERRQAAEVGCVVPQEVLEELEQLMEMQFE